VTNGLDRKPGRIRIFFINCPSLDIPACSYLIAAQNAVQRIFEFEIYDFSVYLEHMRTRPKGLGSRILGLLGSYGGPTRRWAARLYRARQARTAVPILESSLPLSDWDATIQRAIRGHDEWLSDLPRSYGNWSIEAAPAIIVTETPLAGGYFAAADRGLAIVTIAGWNRNYAPPSALEFILHNVQRYALHFVFSLGNHYPTRGCVWDFDANVEDARIETTLGYLCSACERKLAEHASPSVVDEVKHLLSHDWIGKTEDYGSVAGNLRRVFGFDLARTKGLSRGVFEQILEEGGKEALKYLVPLVLGLLLGRYLPQPSTNASQNRQETTVPGKVAPAQVK
jgi:hypothetical protein